MEILDFQGNVRKANDLVGDIDKHVLEGLGWLLHRPETSVLRRCPRRKAYHVHVEGGRELLGDIRRPVVEDLIKLGIIQPSPTNANDAVGNLDFLVRNPEWRKYIPRPKAPRQQPLP